VCPGKSVKCVRALIDLELLADQAHEFVERGRETMHRQHHEARSRFVISETP